VPDVSAFVPIGHPAVEVYRGGETASDGRCVLLWVQRAKRAKANRAANLAVRVADALGLPVIAAFCLVPGYPAATLRSYTFLAEGLAELPAAFGERGIGWALVVGEPGRELPALARELDAAAVVTDQDTLPLGRRWREDAAAGLDVPLVACDTDTVVPAAVFPRLEHAAHTLRPKLWRHIAAANLLEWIADPVPAVRSDLRRGPAPLTALETFAMDRTVGPSPTIRGGRTEGQRRLDVFLRERLDAYAEDRNRPERQGSSTLSPFLHYGQLGPVEVARAAIDHRLGEGSGILAPRGLAEVGPAPHSEDATLQAFLDELITQRDLAVNHALRNPRFDQYEGVPEWGLATLAHHADDPRPILYPEPLLEAGATGDRLWNAAQRQMVYEGFMPNRLRMYWAKQLLLWIPTPREAFDLAIRLNDRYELDGRDPNGYAGIAWSIGGRHDRPFPPKKPVLGLIRPMSLAGMRKKFDVDAYVASVERLSGEPVPGDAGGPAKTPARQERLLPRR
jgi:deoxyribodipyrimidine photo-lyase